MKKNMYNLRKLSLEKKKDENKKNVKSTSDFCTYCKSDELTPYDGYIICKKCGIFLYKEIDNSKEWRNFDSSNKSSDPARCSIPNNALLPESSQGTMVGYGFNDSISIKKIITMNRWKNNPYKEQSMNKNFQYITNICKNGNIPQRIIEETKNIYFKLSQIVNSRRSKRQALIVTSLIIANKINKINNNFNDLAELFNLDIKVLRRQVKIYEEKWKHIIEKEEAIQDIYIKKSILDHESEHKNEIDINNKLDSTNNKTNVSTNKKKDIHKNCTHSNNNEVIKNKSNITKKKNETSKINSIPENKSCKDLKTNSEENTKEPEESKETEESEESEEPEETKKSEESEENSQDFEIDLNKYSDENKVLKKLLHKLNIDFMYLDKITLLNYWINFNNLLNHHIPISKYACIIYIVAKIYKLNISKINISTVCNVSNVTILKCYSKIETYNDIIKQLLDSC